LIVREDQELNCFSDRCEGLKNLITFEITVDKGRFFISLALPSAVVHRRNSTEYQLEPGNSILIKMDT